MTDDQTSAAVAALRVAYPRQAFPDESVRLYVRMLTDLDGAAVVAATERLIRRSAWLPAIAEIREEVVEARCCLPSPAQAWSLVSNIGACEMPDVVRESMVAMGGRWAIVHSESPEAVRAQFLRDYGQRRESAIREAAGSAAPTPALPATSVRELPASEALTPRPVWGRWLRRQRFTDTERGYGEHGHEIMEPPTEAEKHDAIAVLEAAGWGVRPLFEEAQRIMDEASA